MENYVVPLITLAVAMVAAIPGLVAIFMQRKKDAAEAEATVSSAAKEIKDAALSLIKPYQQRITELEARVKELEKKIEQLEGVDACLDDVIVGAHRLCHQLQSAGLTPVYTPPGRRTTNHNENEWKGTK